MPINVNKSVDVSPWLEQYTPNSNEITNENENVQRSISSKDRRTNS